jgi:hypothetical protein
MSSLWRISGVSLCVAALLILPGCKSLNPLCGSARPAPVLTAISPTTETFATLPSSFTLTATGSQFVASSVILFNGTSVATTVVNSTQATATITSDLIPAAGNYTVQVQTPAGNSGDLGCSSGGTSAGQVLTVN